MTKSKLGISNNLLAAGVCLICFFSGITPALLVTGYILLKEDDLWLKKTSVKAIFIVVFFAFITSLIGLIPNCISLVDDAFCIFGQSFSVIVVSNIINFINAAINLVEKFIILLMGYLAIRGDSFKIGFIDKIMEKHFA